MNDLKLVLWRLPASLIPPTGDLAAFDVDWTSNPEMLQHLADGWQVVSHTVVGVEQDLLLTIFLQRPVTVPDTVDGAFVHMWDGQQPSQTACGRGDGHGDGPNVATVPAQVTCPLCRTIVDRQLAADPAATPATTERQVTYRVSTGIDTGPSALEPPPVFLLWDDGTVTWEA